MTSLEKLLIRGIRAFGPENNAIIQFYKPLTLIVGQNGAGKTTIIECLKYSCTGMLPPDSQSGKAWIHDANLAGEREVKAQTRLRFRTAGGVVVVATRIMQVTQGAQGKQNVKTLDSSLQTVDPETREKVAQTRRCADMDLEVPELMGVSKAVLQNVIFCHQEESNWPLEDSSTLKKKFDEIFAATRYTKALEELKKQAKQAKEEHKTKELELKTLAAIKESAHRVRQELEDAKQKLAITAESINEKKGILSDISLKRSKLQKDMEAISQLLDEINSIHAANQQRERSLEELRIHLREELTVPDEELQQMYSSFEEDRQAMEVEYKSLETTIFQLQQKKSALEDQRSSLQRRLGEIAGLQQQAQRARRDRDDSLKRIVKEFKIVTAESLIGGASALSDEIADSVLLVIEQAGEKVEAKFVQLKQDISSENEKLKSEQQQLADSLTELNARVETQRQLLRDAQKLESELVDQMDVESSSVGLIVQLEEEKKLLDVQLMTYKSEFDLSSDGSLQQCLESIDTQLKRDEAKMRTLNDKSRVTYQAKAKLALFQARKEQNARDLELLEESKQEILSRFGESVLEPVQFLSHADRTVEEFTEVVARSRADVDSAIQALSTLEGEKKTIGRALAKLESEEMRHAVSVHREEVQTHLTQTPDLGRRIKEISEHIKHADEEKATLQAESFLFQKFASTAEKSHACPLCHQALPDIREFINSINSKLSEIPYKLESFNLSLAQQNQILELLQSALPDWANLQRIQKVEIPDLKSQLAALENKISVAHAQKQAALQKLADAQAALERIASVRELASRCVDVFNSYSISKHAVDEEADRLGDLVAQAQEHESLSLEMEVAGKSVEELNRAMAGLRDLQQKYNSVEARRLAAANLDHDSVVHQRRLQDVREDIQKYKSTLELLEAQRDDKQSEVDNSGIQTAARIRLNNEKLEKNTARIESFKQSIGSLKMLLRANESLLSASGSDTDATLSSNMKKIEQELSKLQDEISSTTSRREKLHRQVAQSDLTKRNLEENMQYRVMLHEIAESRNELAQKQAKAGATSRADFKQQQERLQKEFDVANAQVNQLVGARKTHEDVVKAKEKELKLDKNKNVDEEYRQMTIKLHTLEAAVKDLYAYYKALDKALMKYHTSKMDEINKIIKELWESTYKGGDIDTIQIKAEVEDASDPLKAKRRQYKYRVVMVKGPTELDMRGRCSAGQKVLASLIIRLALAESFCINCGILALDEPTTNLDKENIDSLALALNSLIEARKASSFQLIVITHDEDFVRSLGRGQHTDFYWRVTKDAQGHSCVEQVPVENIFNE